MIGVIGDAFTDRWVFGSIDRIAPEADCPVMRQERIEEHPGGAAHVAEYITRTGGDALLVCSRKGLKIRYVGRQQVLRVDDEIATPIGRHEADLLFDLVTSRAWEALVLSDYNKGTFAGDLAQRIITWALPRNIPAIVDPKGPWSRYAHCTVITPNEKELGGANPFDLIKQYGFGAVLVTCGGEGMRLYRNNEKFVIPPQIVNAVDVTGAGDVVVAELAYHLAAGCDLKTSAQAANKGAAESVTRWGTQ